MSKINPNNFPVKSVLDGTEEIYTQKPNGNYKYLLSTAIEYFNIGVDKWDMIEKVVNATDLDNIVFNPIQILDESLLAPDEYFEIHKIVILYDFNTTAYTLGSTVVLRFVDNINFYEYVFQVIPKAFIEATSDSIIYFHPKFNHEPYSRNTGLYLTSAKETSFGDGTFTFRVYYKISS